MLKLYIILHFDFPSEIIAKASAPQRSISENPNGIVVESNNYLPPYLFDKFTPIRVNVNTIDDKYIMLNNKLSLLPPAIPASFKIYVPKL